MITLPGPLLTLPSLVTHPALFTLPMQHWLPEQEVYDRSGYPVMAAALKAKGPQYDQVVSGLSYQVAPRAKIFRRDAGRQLR